MTINRIHALLAEHVQTYSSSPVSARECGRTRQHDAHLGIVTGLRVYLYRTRMLFDDDARGRWTGQARCPLRLVWS